MALASISEPDLDDEGESAEINQPLDRVQGEHNRQEHHKVRLLLEALGLQHLWLDLVDWQESNWCEHRLSFAALKSVVPDLPIHLSYAHLYKLEDHLSCSFRAMVLHPERSLIYRAWKAVRDDLSDDGRPIGVIYPYANIPGGLILHNGDFKAPATIVNRQCFVFEVNRKRFTVERFVHVLAAIKDSGWKPGCRPERSPRKIPVAPLLRSVHGTTQKLVMTLFLRILNGEIEEHPDWTSRVEIIVRDGGDRWIALTHQEIGDALGLEVHQVRAALRTLRAMGAVRTQPAKTENLYQVLADVVDG